jgi:hypothetical protein
VGIGIVHWSCVATLARLKNRYRARQRARFKFKLPVRCQE